MERKFDLEIKIHGALFGFFTMAMVGIAGYSNLDLSAQIAFLCSVSIASVSGCILLMLLMITRQYSRGTPEGRWKGDLYLLKLDGHSWIDTLLFFHYVMALAIFSCALMIRVIETPLFLTLLIPMCIFITFFCVVLIPATRKKFI